MNETEEQFINALTRFVEFSGRRAIEDFVKFTKESGLSMPQINVLLHLYYINSSDIAGIKKYIPGNFVAATQIVDRLEERGLVAREINPQDRRARVVQLTEAGKELVQNSIIARHQWINTITSKFSEEEQRLLSQSIVLLIDRIN
ncbi:MAG: MarR family transcriptional regulator [Anaerolineae bacterium]|nr:MarR family transcriptional regulator [Anaerolineae bacterium]